jgi:predicted regulator of Ras-like GTPase activity (Roadblock/LC7/MglB family)
MGGSLHLDTVRPVDAARALADLTEISPQIEAAAVVDGEGGVLGSVGVSDPSAAGLARSGLALLQAAGEFRSEGGRVTQLHAALRGGDVFAVAGAAGRAVVAVARQGATPGLLFYDLKRCLAALEDGGAERG